MKLAWTSRSQYLFENRFLVFHVQPGQISVKRLFQMNILAFLSENTVQCPKTLLLCPLFIYTFAIASLWFFVQLIDLGSKRGFFLLLHNCCFYRCVAVLICSYLKNTWHLKNTFYAVLSRIHFCRKLRTFSGKIVFAQTLLG